MIFYGIFPSSVIRNYLPKHIWVVVVFYKRTYCGLEERLLLLAGSINESSDAAIYARASTEFLSTSRYFIFLIVFSMFTGVEFRMV